MGWTGLPTHPKWAMAALLTSWIATVSAVKLAMPSTPTARLASTTIPEPTTPPSQAHQGTARALFHHWGLDSGKNTSSPNTAPTAWTAKEAGSWPITLANDSFIRTTKGKSRPKTSA